MDGVHILKHIIYPSGAKTMYMHMNVCMWGGGGRRSNMVYPVKDLHYKNTTVWAL